MKNTGLWFIFVGALGVTGVLFLANLFLGELNQDEGWYLYAAGQVAEGRMPYSHYAYTQAPVLPQVYGLIARVFKLPGIFGGRLLTGGLGLIGVGLAAWLAMRPLKAPWRVPAFVTTFALVGCNVYQSYFTTVVKTYSLCTLFLIPGLICLSWTAKKKKGEVICAAAAAGMFLALASGVRLSAGVALPVAGLYLVFISRSIGWRPWFFFGVGGGVGLSGVFGMLYFAAPEGFTFGVIEYHGLRYVGEGLTLLVYKAGFVSRFVQAYFVFCVLLVAVLTFWACACRGRAPAEQDGPPHFTAALWAVGVAITGLHLTAAFPYDDYQTVVYPVLAAALVASLFRLVARVAPGEESDWDLRARTRIGLAAAIFLAATASAFSSPVNQSWMIAGRDRIWWRTKDTTDLKTLQRTAAWLEKRTKPGDTIITQDTYLAVEAGLKVPAGMEMGPFSYYPEWDDEQAETIKVLNRRMMEDLLKTSEARFVAISGYGFSIQCPEVKALPEAHREELLALVRERYDLVKTVEHFGQAYTTLEIYELRDAAKPGVE